MDELIAKVAAAIGVEADVAKSAVGHVLAFLAKELPDGPVKEFLDSVPGAHDAVATSNASADQGSGGLLGGLMSGGLMGLAAKLNASGLDMSQIQKLGREVFTHAESIIGKEKVQQIANSIPGLSQFV